MKKIVLFYLILCILQLILSACTEENISLGINGENGIELLYKYGELCMVDKLPNDEIYTNEYPNDMYCPINYMSISNDSVVNLLEAPVYANDEGEKILNLCRDSVCDHTIAESCISSYGLITYVIETENNVYFVKATGVYRYSLENFTTEPFAIFNTQVMGQFLMGQYLYIQIDYTQYLKVNLTNKQAVLLSFDAQFVPNTVYPSNGYLYIMTNDRKFYRCDSNFSNMQFLCWDGYAACFPQYSFQVYEDKLYYTAMKQDKNGSIENHYILYVRDAGTGELLNTIPDIYCFFIANDKLYAQCYEPTVGPEYIDIYNGTINRSFSNTGNKIYYAPLDDPHNLNVFVELKEGNMCLNGYYLVVTNKYLYTDICVFKKYKFIDRVYRINLDTKEWQLVSSGENYWNSQVAEWENEVSAD